MSVKGLKCQNPYHPPSMSRESMECIREDREVLVFACKACMEVRRLQSIQVKTRAWVKREVRKQLAREGKLMTSAPQVNRKFQMDESLRGKR